MFSIINASYQCDYKISLEFNDHKSGVVDLKDFILSGLHSKMEWWFRFSTRVSLF